MSALPQPDIAPAYSQNRSSNNGLAYDNRHKNVKRIQTSPTQLHKSKAFNRQHKLPRGLRTLLLLQKGSFSLALASMTVSIGFYASTVRIPKLWSQEYHHLENLQRQERQLIAINETIKYQIAHEASQDQKLNISQPESAIFMTPAPFQEKHVSLNSQSSSSGKPKLSSKNRAY